MADNRVTKAIALINSRMDKVAPDKLATMVKGLETSFSDLCEYQNLQSQAFAMGKIRADEAQELYRIYGRELPSPEKWNKLSVAERVVGTKMAAELLEMLHPKVAHGVNRNPAATKIHWIAGMRPACGASTENYHWTLDPKRVTCKNCKRFMRAPGNHYGNLENYHGRKNPDSEGRMTISERVKLLQHNSATAVMGKLGPDVINYIGDRPFAFTATLATDERGHKVCIAIQDEPGYLMTTGSFETNNYHEAQAKADVLNSEMGLPRKEAFMIVASTMSAQKRKEKKFGKRIDNPKKAHFVLTCPKCKFQSADLWHMGDHLISAHQFTPGSKELIRAMDKLDARVYVGSKYMKLTDKVPPLGSGSPWKRPNPDQGEVPGFFKGFHGGNPSTSKTCQVAMPEGPVAALGRLERIDYVVESNGRQKGTHFTHKAGDIGEKMLKSNTIVAADKKGNLFLVKDNEGSRYPHVTDRGILG